jgi:hypothetical protein
MATVRELAENLVPWLWTASGDVPQQRNDRRVRTH